jgi:hypothetical protein
MAARFSTGRGAHSCWLPPCRHRELRRACALRLGCKGIYVTRPQFLVDYSFWTFESVLCPKCKTDHAHRSHRRGPLELLASLVAIYPYRCRECGHRFLTFRYAAPDQAAGTSTVREILSTRRHIEWRRKRREFLLYGSGLFLFLVFLYYITREHGGSSDGGPRGRPRRHS